MAAIAIVGNVNVETNVQVDSFPVEYNPAQFVFFGIQTNVSGVGFNLAKSLITLGSKVSLCGLTGDDLLASIIRSEVTNLGISTDSLLPLAAGTMQSLILYDKRGKRQIFSDLKNIQELVYPVDSYAKVIQQCEICVLTNLNISRPLLHVAQQQGKIVACDVQAISSLDDSYNQDFMQAADILFFSNDRVGARAAELVEQAAQQFKASIIVAGLGSEGALLFQRQRGTMMHIPAYQTRDVVNTVGAGDSLFSSFLHFYQLDEDPVIALRKAMIYASWKIGESGGAQGFLRQAEVEQWYRHLHPHD